LINQISNATLNPCSCFFVSVSLRMFSRRLRPFTLQLIIRITESINSRDIWFSETIFVWVSGKHDCIVGATMGEFNPSELQKRNDFLQQFSSSLVTYLFIIILSMLYFEVDW
jgi:hypothetical protein